MHFLSHIFKKKYLHRHWIFHFYDITFSMTNFHSISLLQIMKLCGIRKFLFPHVDNCQYLLYFTLLTVVRQVHRYGNILWICCNNPLHFVACTKIGTSCSRRSRYSWRRLPVWSLKVVRWGLRTELCKVVGTSEKESNHLYKFFLSAETILGVDLFFKSVLLF